MKKIQNYNPSLNNQIGDILKNLGHCSFQGRALSQCLDVWKSIIGEKDCLKVFALAGAAIPAGMDEIICQLIKHNIIDVIVTTGANCSHALVNAVNNQGHYIGSPDMDDNKLNKKRINRIYDTLLPESNYHSAEEWLEKKICSFKSNVKCSIGGMGMNSLVTTVPDFLKDIGECLFNENKHCFLTEAYINNIPIFCGAISDSELFLNVCKYYKREVSPRILFNDIEQIEIFGKLIKSHKTRGLISIGGGVPRNWSQQIFPYLDMTEKKKYHGYDYGIRIYGEGPQLGHLSGCTTNESKCLHGDTLIDCPRDNSIYPNGIPIKELVDKKNMYVYSWNISKNKVELDKVLHVWKTGREKVYKVVFKYFKYNGKNKSIGSIIATSEHKFMLLNGTYKKLKELKVGDRLKAFKSYISKSRNIMISNNKFVKEHSFICSELYNYTLCENRKLLFNTKCIHHLDGNPLNNNINNLQILTFSEHASLHNKKRWNKEWSSIKKKKVINKIIEGIKKHYKNMSITEKEEYLSKMREVHKLKRKLTEKDTSRIIKALEKEYGKIERACLHLNVSHQGLRDALKRLNISADKYRLGFGRVNTNVTEKDIIKYMSIYNGNINLVAKHIGLSSSGLKLRLKKYNLKEDDFKNHTVISIEYVGIEDIYDMTTEKNHNFVANDIFVHNSWGKYAANAKHAECMCDMTIALPLLASALINR